MPRQLSSVLDDILAERDRLSFGPLGAHDQQQAGILGTPMGHGQGYQQGPQAHGSGMQGTGAGSIGYAPPPQGHQGRYTGPQLPLPPFSAPSTLNAATTPYLPSHAATGLGYGTAGPSTLPPSLQGPWNTPNPSVPSAPLTPGVMAQQTSHAAHHHYFSAGASTTPHFVARFTPQQQPPHAAYPIPQPTEWTGLDPASTSPRTTFRNEIQGIRPRGHAAGGAPAQEPEPAFSGLEDLPPGAQRLWNEPFMPGAAFTGAGGGSGGFAGSSAVRSTPAVPSVQQAGEEDEWPDISPISEGGAADREAWMRSIGCSEDKLYNPSTF